MTVWQNILYGAPLLSGKEKQDRALIRRPRMLLLDEPFSALDRPLRLEMREFLKEVKETFNIPAILVTHDFDEAAAVSDQIIIYEYGRITQTGSPEQVKTTPANDYVSHLVSG